MKWYSASQARQRFADVLDAAERGEPVLIERRGVRFRLRAERTRRRTVHTAEPRIEIMDPAVAEGRWTWAWEAGGARFSRKRAR